MVEIKKVLKEFGLTDNEAEVYLLLLKKKDLQASEIAQKSDIHRINVYDILERLQEKGLVSFSVEGKRKKYEAVNPERILEIEEERKQQIEEIIPELIKQKETEVGSQEAVIFKDKKGMRTVLESITKSKTEVLLFASGWGFSKFFPEYVDIWYSKLKNNKVKMKTLVSIQSKGKYLPQFGEYKFLPSEFVFPSSTTVFDDKIVINIWGSHPMSILITGKEVAQSYREYFNMLWKLAKK